MSLLSKLRDKFYKKKEKFEKTTEFLDNYEVGFSKKLHKDIKKMTYRTVNGNEIIEDKKCENLAHVGVARYQSFDEAKEIFKGLPGINGRADYNVDKLELMDVYNGLEKKYGNRKIMKLENNLSDNYHEILKGNIEGKSAYNTLMGDLKRFRNDYSSEVVNNARDLFEKLEKSLEDKTAGYEVADFQGQMILESRTGSRRIGGGSVN